MIDWTKPIETVEDGQHARVMGLLSLAMAQSPVKADENGFEPMMVWVKGQNNGGWGNVFLVNNEGFRCDDRALFSARQEPFIRNVKVKKEGWVLRSPKYNIVNRMEIYRTKERAQEAALDHEVVCHLTWEE